MPGNPKDPILVVHKSWYLKREIEDYQDISLKEYLNQNKIDQRRQLFFLIEALLILRAKALLILTKLEDNYRNFNTEQSFFYFSFDQLILNKQGRLRQNSIRSPASKKVTLEQAVKEILLHLKFSSVDKKEAASYLMRPSGYINDRIMILNDDSIFKDIAIYNGFNISKYDFFCFSGHLASRDLIFNMWKEDSKFINRNLIYIINESIYPKHCGNIRPENFNAQIEGSLEFKLTQACFILEEGLKKAIVEESQDCVFTGYLRMILSSINEGILSEDKLIPIMIQLNQISLLLEKYQDLEPQGFMNTQTKNASILYFRVIEKLLNLELSHHHKVNTSPDEDNANPDEDNANLSIDLIKTLLYAALNDADKKTTDPVKKHYIQHKAIEAVHHAENNLDLQKVLYQVVRVLTHHIHDAKKRKISELEVGEHVIAKTEGYKAIEPYINLLSKILNIDRVVIKKIKTTDDREMLENHYGVQTYEDYKDSIPKNDLALMVGQPSSLTSTIMPFLLMGAVAMGYVVVKEATKS